MSNEEDQLDEKRNRRILIGFILAISGGSLLYRLLLHEHLGQTSAMFLGIPAVLAILLAIAPQAETVTGRIVKGLTLALLTVAPLLGEGYLCILLAAPLFYAVGIVVGLVADWQREKRDGTLMCVAVVLFPLCLEGVVPQLTFHRTQFVEVKRIVNGSEDAISRVLAASPDVDAPLPRLLRIGFPRPLEAHGSGLEPGATRVIHFAGAEGDPPGDLVMRVTDSRRGYVRFVTVSDRSKLTQWLLWKSSEVRWSAVDRDHTEVTWTIEFDRQLDPAWYFTPWERYAVGKAAAFLIEANATPTEEAAR
ncbi:MAG TPA: hypothetical protein VGG95_01925 [Edaphobacter sp.]|jgi:hypothetical protein